MDIAARDWGSACGVRFRHIQNVTPFDAPKFHVVILKEARYQGSEPLLATAFYPNQNDLSKRFLVIYWQSFRGGACSPDAAVVITHRLGPTRWSAAT